MPASKWKDENYVIAYQMSKSRASWTVMAKAMGTTPHVLKAWCKRKPALVKAIKQGKVEGGQSFKSYVYGRMPQRLREVWNDIMRLKVREDKRGRSYYDVDSLEQLLGDLGKKSRQELFIHALVHCRFNVAEACRMVNVDMSTLWLWKGDPNFVKLLKFLDECKGDFFEGGLMNLVAEGNTNAIIFANKTYNRDRGYGEKSTQSIEVKHDHSHTHRVSVDDLNLDLDTRAKILEARRAKQLPPKVVEGEVVDAG